MKAIHRPRATLHFSAAAVLALALAGCSAPRMIPSATQAPAPTPRPRPATPPASPVPLTTTWQDAPATPGDWTWAAEGGRSVARFSDGLLTLTCDRAAGTVTLARQASGNSSATLTVRTTSISRALTAAPSPGTNNSGTIAVSLPPRDSLLDAIAFSRGRFAVESPGQPTLYVPSWPEISRVIEDCR